MILIMNEYTPFRTNHQEAFKLIPFRGDSLDQLWFLPLEASLGMTRDVWLCVPVMLIESEEHIYKVLSFDLTLEDVLSPTIWLAETFAQVVLL